MIGIKLTVDDFINRSSKIHNNKYDYSLVDYKNNCTKVKIICPIHGIFEQIPSSHLCKVGCPKCSGKNKTNEELILELKNVQGDRYDYSLVDYINQNTKIKIICRIHGIFEQHFYSHRKGNGCPYCNKYKESTTEEFIKKAKNIHGDKYDYSLVNYKHSHKKVKIICSKHGIFEQLPSNHIFYGGCSKCVGRNKTNEELILELKNTHENRYDYSLVNYVNFGTKIKIICHLHGIFEQLFYSHRRGYGCPDCSKSKKSTTEEFIKKAKNIHGDKYDYSLVNYKHSHEKVKIICPKHGVFEQKPINHFTSLGCTLCNESKGEREISKILTKNLIFFERQKKFSNCKNIKCLSFDFYLPEYNLCIEFNGQQHYNSYNYFGGVEKLKCVQKNDNIKIKFCKSNKIDLLIIKYDENIIEKLKNCCEIHTSIF